MPLDALMLVYCLGGAAVALWLDSRFPRLGPGDLHRALLRLAAVLAVGWLVSPALEAALERGISPVAVVLGLVLPVLVLFFLAALWLLRTLQALLPGLRR